MDLMGVAYVISAIGMFIVTVGGFILHSVRTLRADMIAQQHATNLKLVEIGVKVDGQTEKLNNALAAAAKAEGKEEGIKEERRDPQVSAAAQAINPGPGGGPTIIQTPSLQVQAADIQVQKTDIKPPVGTGAPSANKPS